MDKGRQEIKRGRENTRLSERKRKTCLRGGQWSTTEQGCDGEDKEEVGEDKEEVRERTRAQWGEEEEERGTVGGERSGFPCPVKRKWASEGPDCMCE